MINTQQIRLMYLYCICLSQFVFERQGPSTVVCKFALGPMEHDWTVGLECVDDLIYCRCVCVS